MHKIIHAKQIEMPNTKIYFMQDDKNVFGQYPNTTPSFSDKILVKLETLHHKYNLRYLHSIMITINMP